MPPLCRDHPVLLCWSNQTTGHFKPELCLNGTIAPGTSHCLNAVPSWGELKYKDYMLLKNKVEDYFTDLFSRVAWDSFF